jgi:hypothetical protein
VWLIKAKNEGLDPAFLLKAALDPHPEWPKPDLAMLLQPCPEWPAEFLRELEGQNLKPEQPIQSIRENDLLADDIP